MSQTTNAAMSAATKAVRNPPGRPGSRLPAAVLYSLFLAIGTVSAASAGHLAKDPGVVSALTLLDLWIEEKAAYEALPSLSIGIVHDQELVWSHGYGHADLESGVPATPDSRYRAGSVTKVFTATAILQLRDRGLLVLDDPIAKHLPGFSVHQPHAHAAPITVRHLLTHTSGLPREGAFPYWTSHVFPSRDELLAAVSHQSLRSPPGESYRYSNLGISILGALIEELSEENYADYVRENVLGPLGMASSSIGRIGMQDDLLVTGYMRRAPDRARRQHDYYPTDGMAPAAELVTTVRDLARFASLQFRDGTAGGAQILRGSTVREMQRVHFVKPGFKGGMGLGFQVASRGGKTIVSHGGWIGGNRAHLLLVPDEKIAVVAMTNADDASPYPYSYEAYDAVGPALLAAVALFEVEAAKDEAAENETADPEWQHYVGLYSDPWGWEYRVLILDGQLTMVGFDYPPAEHATDGITPLEPVGPRVVDRGVFRMPDGDPVIFEQDDDGVIYRVQRRYDFLFPLGADGLPLVTEIPLPAVEEPHAAGSPR